MIYVRPGKAILAVRYLVPSATSKPTQAEDTLRWIFAYHLADHEEGLVLKAAESRYNDYSLPWVKLKKDYIPGHGDCVDMVILGATWEKVRGRSLRGGLSSFIFLKGVVILVFSPSECLYHLLYWSFGEQRGSEKGECLYVFTIVTLLIILMIILVLCEAHISRVFHCGLRFESRTTGGS